MTDAEELLSLLKDRGQTLALAESTAGGLATAALIAVPGASAVVAGTVVAYNNRSKVEILGVSRDLIREHGAVSAECAVAMAEAARRVFGTDWALAETGIAGPGGGSPERPAGTGFIAAAGPEGSEVRRLTIEGDRDTVMSSTVGELLRLLVGMLV